MARYLVTGGAGFIGSNIVAELLEHGETVRVLDNFSTGRKQNIAPYLDHIDLIQGDLRDLSIVERAVEGIDFILHQGALPSVQRSVDDPLETHATNVTATLNVLIAARDAEVKRVVHASSASIYGDSPTLPKTEDMLPAPLSPYAVSKISGEQYCSVFSEVFGMETVCLRYFNVFGPRQDPTSDYSAVIPLFIASMIGNERPVIYGDGQQSRDFVYVTNVVQANILAATAPKDVAGHVFNIACGQRHTLLELVAALNDILDTDLTPRHTTARPGDVRHSLADISAAETALSYHPKVDFHEGLRRTVAWFRE